MAESSTEEAPMDVEEAATEATAAPLKSSGAAEDVVAAETTTPKVCNMHRTGMKISCILNLAIFLT